MANDREKDLIDRLTEPHDRWAAELEWHRMLLAAYSGTGGFSGSPRLPMASFWGAGSDLYAEGVQSFEYYTPDATSAGDPERTGRLTKNEVKVAESYLDRYAREDAPKYAGRVSLATYDNPVEPVVDIRRSYLARKPNVRKGEEAIRSFLDDADRTGTSWDRVLANVLQLRAMVLGWCPVLVDLPRVELDREISVADAEALGVRPYVVPMFPGNMLDWRMTPEGTWQWVKLSTWVSERPDPLGPETCVQRISIWYPDRVESWDIIDDEGERRIRSSDSRPHRFGRVPIFILHFKAPLAERVRSVSMIQSIGPLAKRLLNYQSELDEALRSSAFAMLQVPTTDTSGALSVVLGGAGAALAIDPQSSRDYKWVQPDVNVVAMYETRMTRTVQSVSRISRSDSAGAGGVERSRAAQSGTSRSYEFDALNASLADQASSQARFDQEVCRFVAEITGADPDGITSTPETKFDVEDMTREIEQALGAQQLRFGATAEAEMKKRLVRKFLPNIDVAKLREIDSEIDEEAARADQARAIEIEMSQVQQEQAANDGGSAGTTQQAGAGGSAA